MGMSDAQYLKAVEDLRRSKAHLAIEDGAQENATFFIEAIGQFAVLTSVQPDPQIRLRAMELAGRCRALTASQVTQALADCAHQLAVRYRNTNHPADVYGHALDEIEGELVKAEKRAR